MIPLSKLIIAWIAFAAPTIACLALTTGLPSTAGIEAVLNITAAESPAPTFADGIKLQRALETAADNSAQMVDAAKALALGESNLILVDDKIEVWAVRLSADTHFITLIAKSHFTGTDKDAKLIKSFIGGGYVDPAAPDRISSGAYVLALSSLGHLGTLMRPGDLALVQFRTVGLH